MSIFAWISIGALSCCVIGFLLRFIQLVKGGAPKDLSLKSGSVVKGVIYSNTGAMLPGHKESAYLHLPTYTAGICFHLGNFLSLALYIWSIICVRYGLGTPALLALILAIFLFISCICGFSIFFKRIFSPSLRSLSGFDDYFSNALCTLLQLCGFLLMLFNAYDKDIPALYDSFFLVASLLFLWMPVGKIKHLLYYFAARFQLGFFYGWRNTWPPKKI